MQLKLKHIVTPSYGLIFVYAISALLIWAVTYVGALHPYGTSFDELWQALCAQPGNGTIAKNLVSFALTLLNAVLLSQLISRFAFTHTRTFLPVVVFVLLVAVWEPSHVLYLSHVALLCFAIALFQFLSMYQNPAATEKAFLGSFFAACASLFVNDLLLIIPVCWLGFVALQSFSLRTFLASLIGVLTPWVIYGAVMWGVFDEVELVHIHFSPGFSMEELMVPTKVYIVLLFAMFFVSLIGTYTGFGRKANNTRKNINFVLVLLVYLLVVFLLQSEFDGTLFPFTAFCFSIFIANVYSVNRNNFYYGMFLLFLVLNLLFMLFNFFW